MNDQQLKALSLDEMRKMMSETDALSADYHVLRRECLRRAEGWGKLANCAGCTILFMVLLVLLAI